MANIRLFGLVLVITSMMLGLVALATQTTTIRIGDTGVFGGSKDSELGDYDGIVPGESNASGEVQFITVPVAYPLMAACCLGFVFWFLPEMMNPKNSVQLASKRRRKRRKR